MKILMHGGFCCGITHIQSFGATPEMRVCAVAKMTTDAWVAYRQRNPIVYNQMQYERPEETYGERFRYLVTAVPVIFGRSSGIIEVVLTTTTANAWQELLTELGFKEVNQHVNSNSGRVLHVFHKNTGA